MKLGIALAIGVLACASCTTRINAFFEHEISSVKDPEALADLRSLGDAKACFDRAGSLDDCDYANDERSSGLAYASYKSYLTPPARLAACIVSVASYQSTPDQLSPYLRTYEPFKGDLQDRDTELCKICTLDDDGRGLAAKLLPIQNKYLARCMAHADELLTHILEAELPVDVATARSARDADSPSFGEKLNYIELKLARIDEIGRDRGFAARSGADLQELRYGVYGPTAMRSAFEHDPAVAPARKELEGIDLALQTKADLARQHDLEGRSDELRAAIATEEAKYSFAATDLRVKAYESAPETVRIKQRLSAMRSELVRADEVRDIARTDALVAEQRELEAQLVTLRKRFEISWSIY
jgi:hypothetical protein